MEVKINNKELEKYCTEKIKEEIAYLKSEEAALEPEDLLAGLQKMEIRVAGLRDLFHLFDHDHVAKMCEPIKKAIAGLGEAKVYVVTAENIRSDEGLTADQKAEQIAQLQTEMISKYQIPSYDDYMACDNWHQEHPELSAAYVFVRDILINAVEN